MKTKDISTHFALLVGKDEDKVLNFAFQVAMDSEKFVRTLGHLGLLDTFKGIAAQMIAGTDKVTWCNTEGCEGGDCEHKNQK